MENNTDYSKRPGTNITWQSQPLPAHCEHQYEAIACEEDGTILRCVKCRSLEAR